MPLTRLRRYAAVPFLCATVVAGWKVYHPAPVYRAITTVNFQAPLAESRLDDKLNPKADPRRSVAATAAEVALGMEEPTEAARLHAMGVAGAYDLEPRNSGTSENPYNSIPRMDISADAGDPASAIRSVTILEQQFNADLVALQDQVPVYPTDRITVEPLAPNAQPSVAPVLGSKSRALMATTVLCLGAAYLVPKWLESALSRRPERIRPTTATRRPRRGSASGTAA
jgi:hypothetical protein